MASGWEFKSGGQTIAIEFSDQRLSPHAGSATFWGWLRHRVRDADEGRVGKRLLDGPGWRYYSGRADCENGIKELRAGFALPALCLASFWATEAALSMAVLTYNLTVLFQRHLGWQQKVTIHSLRFWRFVTAGVLSHPRGKTTVKLAVPRRERAWWRGLWEKILSPLPNCNAVENRPVFNRSTA